MGVSGGAIHGHPVGAGLLYVYHLKIGGTVGGVIPGGVLQFIDDLFFAGVFIDHTPGIGQLGDGQAAVFPDFGDGEAQVP